VRTFRALLTALVATLAGWAQASETVCHPFVGVTYTVRAETAPRPLRMHIVDIDLAASGIRFRLTPHSGPLHTGKQTTLGYLRQQQAQIAINAHFFEPWPAPSPDPGTASLVGIAASDGQVYAPFLDKAPKQYAIQPNAPGLNIDAGNHACIVHRNAADPSGYTVAEPVTLHNTLAGNEQIVTSGRVTAVHSDWNSRLDPRTAIGLTRSRHLIFFVVDGRQPGISEGMSVPEVAHVLAGDYGIVDALGLDGGGSTTLAIADPTPRVVNVSVGVKDAPGTERAVGSNLAVFAQRPESTSTTCSASGPDAAPSGISARPCLIIALGVCFAAGLVVLAWQRRSSRAR
jgi:hypothetical protein